MDIGYGTYQQGIEENRNRLKEIAYTESKGILVRLHSMSPIKLFTIILCYIRMR